jgi:hypothetical protein
VAAYSLEKRKRSMSMDFVIDTKASATGLFSGILEPFGIREKLSADSDDASVTGREE